MKKVVCCLVILIFMLLLFTATLNMFEEPTPITYEEYVVKQGDTLWGIARNSDMWNKIDASYIIDDMKERSNCTATIYPGQVVYVPMYND